MTEHGKIIDLNFSNRESLQLLVGRGIVGLIKRAKNAGGFTPEIDFFDAERAAHGYPSLPARLSDTKRNDAEDSFFPVHTEEGIEYVPWPLNRSAEVPEDL